MRLTGVLVVALGCAPAAAPVRAPSPSAPAPAPRVSPPGAAPRASLPAQDAVADAEAGLKRGRAANERWEFAKAVRELEPALAVFDKALAKNDPRIEKTLRALAGAYRGDGRWDLAEGAAQRWLAFATEAADTQEEASADNELGLVYEESGRDDAAIPMFQAAIDLADARHATDDDSSKNTAEHNLALAYGNRGEYAKAEVLLERVLAANRRKDPQSVDTANTMHNLALDYRDDGKLDQAKAMFEAALEILSNELGSQHPQLGPTLNGLAGTLKLQNKPGLAEPLYRQALAIAAASGTYDYIAAEELADIQTDRGHAEEAVKLLAESLSAQHARFGSAHAEMVKALVKRLRAHLGLKDLVAAEADTKEAIAMSREVKRGAPDRVRATIKWAADEWQRAGLAKRAAAVRELKP